MNYAVLVLGSVGLPSLALGGFLLATAVILGTWIYHDARARQSRHPLKWAVAIGILPFVLVPYISLRGDRISPPSHGERLALPALLGCLFAWITGTLLASPNPVSHAKYVFGILLVSIPAAYLLISPEEAKPVNAAE
jgi:fructose-specific phosphotransferase system IIC component